MYRFDKRIVLTLDGGGTNFVFSAMQANVEITTAIQLPSNGHDLKLCLENIYLGFTKVKEQLSENPVAISFAFPGPADYANGIIGVLQNLKGFQQPIALGPLLEEKFGIPVYINNDGNLYALGEAQGGFLCEINKLLEAVGNPKRYKNLLALTFGTGLGSGFINDGKLMWGDNGCAANVWAFRHKKLNNCISEESVGVLAVQRLYAEFSGDTVSQLTPKDIFEIADGMKEGNQKAAIKTFRELGEEAGNVIAHSVSIIDGLVVIGGGLSGAAKFFMPALIAEINSHIGKLNGDSFPRLEMKAYNLENKDELNEFLTPTHDYIEVLGTNKKAYYDFSKRIGVSISAIGTSRAIALGAYSFALNKLDENKMC